MARRVGQLFTIALPNHSTHHHHPRRQQADLVHGLVAPHDAEGEVSHRTGRQQVDLLHGLVGFHGAEGWGSHRPHRQQIELVHGRVDRRWVEGRVGWWREWVVKAETIAGETLESIQHELMRLVH